jgi:membrane protease YdiL (CAAX protease family)
VGAQVANGLIAEAPPSGDEADSGLQRHAQLALGAYAAQLVVVGIYGLCSLRAARPVPDRRWTTPRAAMMAAVLLLLWWPLAQATALAGGVLIGMFTGEDPSDVAHRTLEMLLDSPRDVWFVVTLVSVTVVAPLVEEVLYRGILQNTFRRLGYGPWSAVLITSGVFAVMHASVAEPHAVVSLMVLSLGLGWAYERTGRLGAPVVMHMLFNAGNLALAFI